MESRLSVQHIIPNARLAPTELLFFRLYQGMALVQWMWYCAFLVGFMMVVNFIYRGALINGAGGAVLGTFTGLIYAVAFIVLTRVFLEVCMLVFEIRDNVLSRNDSHPPAPPPVVIPAESPVYAGGDHISSGSGTTTSYQGYSTS
ncbi:hypothetical protein Pelo_11787 [Pelomyxa schiedti]|nr:hypothetical protein Pelo_11787 [Pelomyxa schiedti]